MNKSYKQRNHKIWSLTSVEEQSTLSLSMQLSFQFYIRIRSEDRVNVLQTSHGLELRQYLPTGVQDPQQPRSFRRCSFLPLHTLVRGFGDTVEVATGISNHPIVALSRDPHLSTIHFLVVSALSRNQNWTLGEIFTNRSIDGNEGRLWQDLERSTQTELSSPDRVACS